MNLIERLKCHTGDDEGFKAILSEAGEEEVAKVCESVDNCITGNEDKKFLFEGRSFAFWNRVFEGKWTRVGIPFYRWGDKNYGRF